MKITNNHVCEPTKPKTSDTKASRCLKLLLNGGVLNRKNLGDLGIAANNDSAHSLISILRNERFIPVESRRISDETCNYYMKPEEIIRYKDPALRPQQREEMKAQIMEKRVRKIIDEYSELLECLTESPQLWQYFNGLQQNLSDTLIKINALLLKKKGVN